MKELYYLGGPWFMSILTILLVIMSAWSVIIYISLLNKKKRSSERLLKLVDFNKSIGLFALMIGFLGQLIGMYGIFSDLQQVKDISIKIFFGGLKVAMISTIYGIIIYLLSIVFWFAIKYTMLKYK